MSENAFDVSEAPYYNRVLDLIESSTSAVMSPALFSYND